MSAAVHISVFPYWKQGRCFMFRLRVQAVTAELDIPGGIPVQWEGFLTGPHKPDLCQESFLT